MNSIWGWKYQIKFFFFGMIFELDRPQLKLKEECLRRVGVYAVLFKIVLVVVRFEFTMM